MIQPRRTLRWWRRRAAARRSSSRSSARSSQQRLCSSTTIRTQSPRRDVGLVGARRLVEWDDVTDLQGHIPDDDTLDQQLEDRLLLVEGYHGEAVADALAEPRQAAERLLGAHLLLAEPLPLLVLLGQYAALLREACAALGQLLQRDHLRLVRVHEPRILPPEPF